ncbi:uncharacterized protein I303_105386 [Kwoniella dejecticola CBS 10117]|uniref:Uncharacterized protein n=1 Tax=Kwoniella dejecticola CBS 10117 TaxID=1296121 RepID=A0A1A6A2M8_9TREE|nr:uncharacterized protein I303_05169 [Kwoniella dejecticola CBS 10117]OBR84311.1 hypothetical protein I303_05169 [Kwoniella dejecticola CBS 10117]
MNDQPGPSKGYTFPHYTIGGGRSPAKENIDMNGLAPSMSPTSSSTGLPAGPSMTSTAQHRLSVSGRPRRPSPLLHEIQPPSRRLSAHQMLLLTPFGGPLPAGALAGAGGNGMSRGSSSMGHGLPTAPARIGSATSQSGNWPRRDSSGSTGGTAAIPLGRDSSSTGRYSSTSATGQSMGRDILPPNRFPPRSRHSLGHPIAGTSPLASAPMTTIFSQGSSEGKSSRSKGSSGQETERNQTFMSREEIGKETRPSPTEGDGEEDDTGMMSPPRTRARLLSATVAMTRSNSLPVLTLRELEALKEKDGELGIQRGGDWAWVSRDTDDPDELDVETPSMDADTSTNASTSTSSLVTPSEQPLSASSSSSSSYRNPFTSFNDPFAPRQPGVSPVSMYTPIATSSDYHYSPTGAGAELRRMSDAPPQTSTSATATPSPTLRSGRRSDTDHRRPSAPNAYNQPFGSLTPKAFQRRTPPQASQSIFQASYQPLAPEETSPHGSPIASLPPASRPRLLRYKSSPARTTGLGLNIVVRPTGTGRNSGSDKSPGDPTSASGSNRGSLGEQSSRGGTSRNSLSAGRWAEVDFIDSLAAAADIVLASTSTSTSNNTGSNIPSAFASGSNTSATGMSRTSSSISPTSLINRDLANSRLSTSSFGSNSSFSISPSRRSGPSGSSIRAGTAIGSRSEPQTATTPGYQIEQITSRSHITDFQAGEPVFKGRSRFESVDSAFPLMPGGRGERLSVPAQGAGEAYNAYSQRNSSFSAFDSGTGLSPPSGNVLNEGFPRRGSLGMGTFAKLRKMVAGTSNKAANSSIDEMGYRTTEGGTGDRSGLLNVANPSGPAHWSERRGSWAEGWSSGR